MTFLFPAIFWSFLSFSSSLSFRFLLPLYSPVILFIILFSFPFILLISPLYILLLFSCLFYYLPPSSLFFFVASLFYSTLPLFSFPLYYPSFIFILLMLLFLSPFSTLSCLSFLFVFSLSSIQCSSSSSPNSPLYSHLQFLLSFQSFYSSI